jgi:hypothetical protein
MRTGSMLFSLLTLLGCDPQPPMPEKAGVSESLRYPVLLIGQASLDVRDDEAALVSIPGASSLNLVERVVLDSNGDLFRVTKADPVKGQPSPLWSMGTQSRNFTVTLAKQPRPSWPEVRRLVLEQVSAPNSTSNGNAQAVARVNAFSGVAELIEASRETWNWGR